MYREQMSGANFVQWMRKQLKNKSGTSKQYAEIQYKIYGYPVWLRHRKFNQLHIFKIFESSLFDAWNFLPFHDFV